MTNSERYQKYIKEHCNKCKNKETNLCDIRIFVIDDKVNTGLKNRNSNSTHLLQSKHPISFIVCAHKRQYITK